MKVNLDWNPHCGTLFRGIAPIGLAGPRNRIWCPGVRRWPLIIAHGFRGRMEFRGEARQALATTGMFHLMQPKM